MKISNSLRIALVVFAGVLVLALIFGLSTNKTTGNSVIQDLFGVKSSSTTTTEGKPAEVVAWSNGFPSGEHYNLNIHGKKDGFTCDPTAGGNSIFVSEYGQSEIQFIQNRKATLAGMNVIDPCSFSPQDPAKIQLPTGEYQVYARILAKPGNTKKLENRSVIFYPKLIDACNDNATAPIVGFEDYIDCTNESLIGLGVITAEGVFDKDSQSFTRISPVRGKNKAQEITDLFQWSGYACGEVYDVNADGEISLADITADQDGDGDIDADDLTAYLELYCSYYQSEWIFNIADLVVYGWDYYNSGSKLLQVRFYPEKTTEYI